MSLCEEHLVFRKHVMILHKLVLELFLGENLVHEMALFIVNDEHFVADID